MPRACLVSSRSVTRRRATRAACAPASPRPCACLSPSRPRARAAARSPRDRLLGEFPVKGQVGDDRRAAVKLDQHAGGARLVNVVIGEADCRRGEGILVDLPVQLLGFGDERDGLRAQPQRLQIVGVDRVEVRPERVLPSVAQHLADRPSGIVVIPRRRRPRSTYRSHRRSAATRRRSRTACRSR